MFQVSKNNGLKVSQAVFARSFSASSRTLNNHGEHHHEEHHHHGPELAPADSPINSQVLYLFGVSAAILGAYSLNKSWESKHDGKTILQSLLGKQITVEDVQNATKEYRSGVEKKQQLFQLFQLNQPERVFHEFTQDRVIPAGSYRNVIPGSTLNLDEIEPRRERARFFKDL